MKRNALFSSTDLSWGAYALIGAVLLLLMRLLAPNFFLHMVAPVFRSADFVTAKSHVFFSSFGDTAKLTLQNEELAEENIALATENQTLLQKEADLEALLNAPMQGESTGEEVLAGVVARPPESPYDTLVLGEGAHAGITPGQEVFGAGGVPIGIVSSVTADFSRVILFSSPKMTVHGWVGHENVPLTLMGSGAGVMRATLARSVGVVVGDKVWVPGPGTLPIGSVMRIDSDPSSPTVILHIQPAVNLFSVTWVVVRDTGTVLKNAFSQATSTFP